MMEQQDRRRPSRPSLAGNRRSSMRRASTKKESSMRSLFSSAFTRIDSFLMLDRTGDRKLTDDAESVVSDLRHLGDAEDALRRELDGIGLSDDEQEEEDAPVAKRPSLKSIQVPRSTSRTPPRSRTPVRRSSSFSLKRQVTDESLRNLGQRLNEVFHSLDLDDVASLVDADTSESNATPLSTSPDRETKPVNLADKQEVQSREIKEREYAPQVIVVQETSFRLIERLAMVAFGRNEYTVKPALSLSKPVEPCVRVAQGGVVVAMAAAVIVSRVYLESALLPLLLVFVPPATAWIEVNLPHRMEETTIAFVMLAIHFVISQFQGRGSFVHI